MIAAEALRKPRVRRDIGAMAHACDETVKAFLRGFPSAQKQDELLASAQAVGVDVATIPERTPEEIAAHREKRRGNAGGAHARIASLSESVAAERARADAAEARVLELAALLEQSQAQESRAIMRVAELSRRYAKLRTFAADMVRKCRDTDAEVNRWKRAAEAAETERDCVIDQRDQLQLAANHDTDGREAVREIARLQARVAELEAQLATRESGGPFAPVVYPAGTVAAIDAEDARGRATLALLADRAPIPAATDAPTPAPIPLRRPKNETATPAPRLRVYLPGSDAVATLDEVASLPAVRPEPATPPELAALADG